MVVTHPHWLSETVRDFTRRLWLGVPPSNLGVLYAHPDSYDLPDISPPCLLIDPVIHPEYQPADGPAGFEYEVRLASIIAYMADGVSRVAMRRGGVEYYIRGGWSAQTWGIIDCAPHHLPSGDLGRTLCAAFVLGLFVGDCGVAVAHTMRDESRAPVRYEAFGCMHLALTSLGEAPEKGIVLTEFDPNFYEVNAWGTRL